jgi:hypothetical protein
VAGLTSAAGAAQPESLSIALQAEYEHGSFATRISGVVELALAQDETGGDLATLLLRAPDCFTLAAWEASTSPPLSARPAGICLADAGADESTINALMGGTRGLNADLRIPLEPGTAGDLVNSATVISRLFLRGCGSDSYRLLGELEIGPGLLLVNRGTDSAGRPSLDLTGAGLTLGSFPSSIWTEILSNCDGSAIGLPANPSSGVSTSFLGTSTNPPLDPNTIGGQLEGLIDAVDLLVNQQTLALRGGRRLLAKLDRVTRKLSRGRTNSALRGLTRFDGTVSNYVAQGALPSQAGNDLHIRSNALGTAIQDLGSGPAVPAPDPIDYCDPDPPASCPVNTCVYTTYHVTNQRLAGSAPAPDGSEARPFLSIGDALARAEELDLCGVEIILRRGQHRGEVVLSRHLRLRGDPDRRTTLTGRGSITSTGPYTLEVEDLRLMPFGEAPGIVADDPCASTALRNVDVIAAKGFGVRQRGGSLHAVDVRVLDTQSEPAFVSRGTGIYVHCGAHASLWRTELAFNDSAALHIADPGTSVEANGLEVRRTGVHPTIEAGGCRWGRGVGAVQARDSASLELVDFDIRNNLHVGMVVGWDAEADLLIGRISRTRRCDSGRGGFDLISTESASARLTLFSLDHGETAGAYVEGTGEMDLHIGWVEQNAVGAAIRAPAFDLARLRDGVIYRFNERNLQTEALPLPEVVGGIDP